MYVTKLPSGCSVTYLYHSRQLVFASSTIHLVLKTHTLPVGSHTLPVVWEAFPRHSLSADTLLVVPLTCKAAVVQYVLLEGRDVHVCSTKYMGIHKLEADLQKFI